MPTQAGKDARLLKHLLCSWWELLGSHGLPVAATVVILLTPQKCNAILRPHMIREGLVCLLCSGVQPHFILEIVHEAARKEVLAVKDALVARPCCLVTLLRVAAINGMHLRGVQGFFIKLLKGNKRSETCRQWRTDHKPTCRAAHRHPPVRIIVSEHSINPLL